ncbi:MAG: DUF5681 domain-containing protein [Sphingomonadales bacterium]
MSNDNKRVPPKEHQFKPGQSGNPRGRPRKRRRAHIPSQVTKEVLAIAGSKVTIKTADGEITISRMELLFRSLVDQAIKGKPTPQKIFLPLLLGALHENVKLHPEYELVDTLEKLMRDKGVEIDAETGAMLDVIAQKSLKPF